MVLHLTLRRKKLVIYFYFWQMNVAGCATTIFNFFKQQMLYVTYSYYSKIYSLHFNLVLNVKKFVSSNFIFLWEGMSILWVIFINITTCVCEESKVNADFWNHTGFACTGWNGKQVLTEQVGIWPLRWTGLNGST